MTHDIQGIHHAGIPTRDLDGLERACLSMERQRAQEERQGRWGGPVTKAATLRHAVASVSAPDE